MDGPACRDPRLSAPDLARLLRVTLHAAPQQDYTTGEMALKKVQLGSQGWLLPQMRLRSHDAGRVNAATRHAARLSGGREHHDGLNLAIQHCITMEDDANR